MTESLLLYLGLAVAACGLLSILVPLRFLGIRSRLRALGVFGAGTILAGLALALPVPEARRSSGVPSRLDDFVPEFQWNEIHELPIRAAPDAVDRAIRAVPAEEIRFFRVLTWIRNPRRPWSDEVGSILHPPAKRPILEVALASGFVLLADEPRREIVLGTLVVRPPGEHIRVPDDPAETGRRFMVLSDPGFAKAAMSFRIEPQPGGTCLLTTETRIFATDRATARRFAVYWRFIYPGSALIRRSWLRAIAARAEGPGG